MDSTASAGSPVSPVDPIDAELFRNRFSNLAREMGEVLSRTALSVNVKERLDFSCALLDARGRLVVNAPHIPVHLGALGLCTRTVAAAVTMNPGDTVVTNHPQYGGSHLPDVTLITPVFHGPPESQELLGYVANRAHHAEIGGCRPGSMPPFAENLADEGVVISPIKLLAGGVPAWEVLERTLTSGPWPSRAPDLNLADLRAGLAANERGVRALLELADTHGKTLVTEHMQALQQHAASRARAALGELPSGVYRARDSFDDGTPIEVAIHVTHPEKGEGRAVIDFAGTGPTHPKSLNAPRAVTQSAVLYVLRLMVKEALPLNEGLLEPVEIKVPPATCLSPTFDDDPTQCPAVVGGNVEVSQRVVEVMLRALGLAAASQGTMNNTLFGNQSFGYYETIGGGSGATSEGSGGSAFHVHMTNTRITDPEVLEHRYPVRLERFAIRQNSGGVGQHRGGNGLTRHIRFLEPVEVSILSQQRGQGPKGIEGGGPGAPGRQELRRASGGKEPLEALAAVEANANDVLVIETPGGGGWGETSQSVGARSDAHPGRQHINTDQSRAPSDPRSTGTGAGRSPWPSTCALDRLRLAPLGGTRGENAF